MPSSMKQEHQPNIQAEDTIAGGATMYPVFCIASIPLNILDEFIEESYKGLLDMDVGDPGVSPCILTTTDLDSITHGSRKPMRAFESPFFGKSDDEIRAWMREHEHPNFAQLTFTILDEHTIKNKTCRVGYTGGDDRMLITDFYAHLYIRVPIEMVTLSWDEEEYVGTGKVFNRKYIENGLKEV